MSVVPPGRADRSAHEVLVVDDNPATRYSTSRVLRAAGFRIKEAGTGFGALELAATGVSAVILDVHLPDIDGFEVCGRIRTRIETALLPVIHLSASRVMNDDKVRGLEGGADAYMTHPAEPTLLVATLDALIRARTAEEAMRRSDAGFRAIYEQAPSGISLLDESGRFLELNPAMLSMLRRRGEEVAGRNVVDYAPQEWREHVRDALAKSHRAVWRGEFPLLDGAGATVHMAWSLSTGASSRTILAIATDVSERIALSRQRDQLLEREQAARASAEAVSRSKDEFIAVLSHELRTPLNAIVGWTHVLKLSPEPQTLARGLQAIERNAKVQTRLISDILDVSRIRLGKLRLELETVDALEIVNSSVAALSVSFEEKSLTVAIDAPGSLPAIVADPARLQQIVWNLLTNAIKFSAPHGEIRVALALAEASMTIAVEDDGQGIDPDFLPSIFDRFTQSDPASNRVHGGLGLGLAIVKQLAELHGGYVEASSVGKGRGSRFAVTLPLVAKDPGDDGEERVAWPDEQEDRAGRAGLLEGLTLLVVEDDLDAREFLPHVFERFRQEDSTIRRGQGGLGLGLAIVKHVVESQGGSISAKSGGENRGATFTARFRRRQPRPEVAAEVTAAGAGQPSLHGVRALVVEDDDDARILVARTLADAGASVRDVTDVQSAIDALGTFAPDVLVSDIGMPQSDGYDLIRRVRALGYGADRCPAIALTAFAREEDGLRALSAGYQVHLAKPIYPRHLVSVASRVLEDARKARIENA